jgi:hypothetical protein
MPSGNQSGEDRRAEAAEGRLSRRRLGGLAAGAAAALAGRAAMSEPQTGKSAEPPPAGDDPRVALIERGRSAPLTEAQRKALVEAYKTADKEWAPAREFSVPDGTAPDFVFRPTPVAARDA